MCLGGVWGQLGIGSLGMGYVKASRVPAIMRAGALGDGRGGYQILLYFWLEGISVIACIMSAHRPN